MAVEIILPRVDMDMTAGKISKWHVKDGDSVAQGAPLFEIETDKAAMEIEAPAAGIIRDITVAEGTSTPVGSVVAYIYSEGEAAPAPQAVNGIRATPLARRLAKQASLSLTAITGSGPRGRVVAADIRKAIPVQVPPQLAPAQPPGFDLQPIDNMRRTIAQRLTRSKQTVPHFYLSTTCTLDKLLEARESLNASAPKDETNAPLWRLSINDFIIKAMALALQRVPTANVTWTDEGIRRHRSSDIGVAVAVEGGLFTPVLRAVETKPLAVISQEMKSLATKARDRKLAPSEYQGGSTAISNLGMYGIEDFIAIINPPHASILAVGAAVERFVPVDRQPVLKTQMSCTLSCDHRVVDGATGAQLSQALRSFIENPFLMLA